MNQDEPKQNGDNVGKIDWQTQANEYLNGWKRAKADFINYKKRQEEAIVMFRKYAREDFVLEFLPIIDNFDEAVKHLPENENQSRWIQGIVAIKTQLGGILKNHGVQEIKTISEKFNPEFHEAVEAVESEKESGMILEELRKGYTLNGKVIRAAKVRISK
ncbi:MAG: nucleotide exchange factor GrpE [Parcubacteria group bacterium GW2011_GWA2_38_13b]|nr:MAG: nucleotide exchange factor GrpE [Parcubacteria group bacterium GW2011_GWA2_38_13b]